MEKEIGRIEIFKDFEEVAYTETPVTYKIIKIEQVPKVSCYSSASIKLHRREVLQVLNGRPLGDFINGARIKIFFKDGSVDELTPVYYIHGRVEVFRGRPSITAVAFVHPLEDCDYTSLAQYFPVIYKVLSCSDTLIEPVVEKETASIVLPPKSFLTESQLQEVWEIRGLRFRIDEFHKHCSERGLHPSFRKDSFRAKMLNVLRSFFVVGESRRDPRFVPLPKPIKRQ
jgi:hypothetical protein